MRQPRRWRTVALATIALATAAIIGARDDSRHAITEPTQERTPGAGRSPRASNTQERIDRLATSGPANPRAAVELDELPPAGFIARERPRALAVARRFLDAYFTFEVREGGARAVREVAQTATPGLAADLLSGGAQLPAAMDRFPPRAEMYAIDIEFDKPPTAAQVRAEVKRASDRSDIAVIVQRRETRWVVSQIIE